jgi:hypothetical protein
MHKEQGTDDLIIDQADIDGIMCGLETAMTTAFSNYRDFVNTVLAETRAAAVVGMSFPAFMVVVGAIFERHGQALLSEQIERRTQIERESANLARISAAFNLPTKGIH